MNSRLLTLGTLLAIAASLGAAEPAAPPTAQQILDRYVEAAGGRAALEKLKSRVMKGKIEVTALGVTGPFEVRAKAPNKQVSTVEFEGFGAMREGFDGTVAWAVAPLQGVRTKSGGELARVQRSTVFPRELKFRETYDRLEAKGASKVGAADTWVLEGTVKNGKPDRLYFDQKSGLLLREETVVESPVGEMNFQIDLSDYRDIDGIKVPFTMRVPQPAEVGFQIRFDEVKHNVDLADTEFAKPAQ
jgi:hypothetical protein